ncbi:MAG: DNA-3-methyladenine glycosylase 2 family protein [Pelagibacterales bacterium]|nr:DNA-3-methyladenine glycosylase 2 family protein [Pelagibacterales bacterium]
MTIKKPPNYWKDGKNFLSKKDKVLKKIIGKFDGFLKTRKDPFFSLCRSIVGQQISVKAADAVWMKFEKKIGIINPGNVLKVSKQTLRGCGFSRQKIDYLRVLSKAFLDGDLNLKYLNKLSDEEAIKYLIRLKGIGRWTAQMFLIFNLRRKDIFPEKDIGLLKAICKQYKKKYPLSETQIGLFKRKWSPYSTIATWYMWRSIDPVPVEY